MKKRYKIVLAGLLSISSIVSADESAYWDELLGWNVEQTTQTEATQYEENIVVNETGGLNDLYGDTTWYNFY